MKYLIRSVKYFFYFMILCVLFVTIVYYATEHKDGVTLQMLFTEGGSIYKMLAMFAAFAAIYPAVGFQKKEIYVSNFKENKREVIALFLNANYQIKEETDTTIVFSIKNPLIRAFRMCEDEIIIDFSGNPVIIDGLRKDVLRFSRGIEYICRKEA
ncbi:MAG: hypothetical protein IIW66_00995 [Bacteroidales bacterium]|nr:hypothetical protein [Bacteroidales bacterium]MBQ1929688.1 hypothetical protein [Bacteroidales bacterium]MBQ5863955.1 hypothetical protein [Bacteroidales bacterium]